MAIQNGNQVKTPVAAQVDELQARVADRSGRLRFQYPDLRRDLERMRAGISDYIEADLQIGRTFTPLRGSYR